MFCRGEVLALTAVRPLKGGICRAVSVLEIPAEPMGDFKTAEFLSPGPAENLIRSWLRCKMDRAPFRASAVKTGLPLVLLATALNDLPPRRFTGSTLKNLR